MAIVARPQQGRNNRIPAGWNDRPCLGTPIELWFGPEPGATPETADERTEREDRAKELCRTCPVLDYCLADELTRSATAQWGVRGGLTADERAGLIRARRAARRRAVA